MSELYTKDILRLTTQIPAQQRLNDPDQSLTRRSRICGSSLELDVMLSADGSTITDFGWDVKACALGQASAAIIGKQMVGMTERRVLALKNHMNDMLRDGQEVDWDAVMDGDFAAMKALKPATGNTGRLGAIFLPVDILIQLWR